MLEAIFRRSVRRPEKKADCRSQNVGVHSLRNLYEDGDRVGRQQQSVIVDEEQVFPFCLAYRGISGCADLSTAPMNPAQFVAFEPVSSVRRI